MSYKPLPHGLTILKSKIDGLGLFATQHISENTVLGVIHVQDSRFENNCIRTPLGGFINHSEDPNLKSFSEKFEIYFIFNVKWWFIFQIYYI